MTPLNKLYLKTFLICGIAFALLMSGSDLYRGKAFDLSDFLIKMAVFGFFMSLVLVKLHTLNITDLGITELTKENLSVKQKRTISSELNIEELRSRIQDSKYFKGATVEINEKHIVIKLPFTWKSFGEQMHVQLASQNEDQYQYIIGSKNRGIVPLVDYGKNLGNVLEIEKLLS